MKISEEILYMSRFIKKFQLLINKSQMILTFYLGL